MSHFSKKSLKPLLHSVIPTHVLHWWVCWLQARSVGGLFHETTIWSVEFVCQMHNSLFCFSCWERLMLPQLFSDQIYMHFHSNDCVVLMLSDMMKIAPVGCCNSFCVSLQSFFEGQSASWDAAKKEQNRTKNRYGNIIACKSVGYSLVHLISGSFRWLCSQ